MADLPVLTPIDQRILGCLMEKEVTVPATFPLTLNALRTACNQTSSRDPITAYGEREIEHALSDLKLRKLVRFEHSGTGSRVMKYRHLVDEALGLADDERAVLTVLLLRGAQSAGEIKTRTERLHGFHDTGQVEETLVRMAARNHPLVVELPKRPGWRDTRWMHLLGVDAPAPAGPEPAAPAPDADLDAAQWDARNRAGYDTVAATYSAMLLDELDHKPFERWLLERLASQVDGAPLIEVGCGPGHVGAYLAACGADVTVLDNCAPMVEQVRRHFPALRAVAGDLREPPLPPAGGGWTAIVAWYALVNLTMDAAAGAITALARALAPGGRLALALHAGPEVRHIQEWWGHTVDMRFVLHDPRAVRAAVTDAGLVIDEWYLRSPLPDVEVDTERLVVLARRPS